MPCGGRVSCLPPFANSKGWGTLSCFWRRQYQCLAGGVFHASHALLTAKGWGTLSCSSASPSSTRSRTSGQEDLAHGHDPHEADEGRDEPRIGAVRCPESTAQPRGAAQQDEDD